MQGYSEEDLKKAARLRDEIHGEALLKVRTVIPGADRVIDKYPADAYFDKVWDYPGTWYTVISTPPGTGGRKNLVDIIVRETLEFYRNAGAEYTDDEFYKVLSEYPDVACDYRFINANNEKALETGVFPYRGVDSHRLALACAAGELSRSGEPPFDTKSVKPGKLSGKALFAPVNSDEWLNYRKAFLCLPHGNSYTDDDFDRVNAVLFPGGADELEVYRWTADRSDPSGEDQKRRGALCLTVYDKTLDRFVVITAF